MTAAAAPAPGVVPHCSDPAFRVPAGACDAHAHVFGPYQDFPLAAERTYTPPECPGHAYLQLLRRLRFDRGVVVQGTAHGQDNRAMLAALAVAPQTLRGVAVADRSVTDDTLMDWRSRGVRGLRFAHIPGSDGQHRYRNVIGIEDMQCLAPRLKEHGMHVQLWTHGAELAWIEPLLSKVEVPVVIDHMGRFDIGQGIGGASFRNVCRLLESGKVWIKLTAYRNVVHHDALHEVKPFHDALIRINPERLLWGSDWPHVNCAAPMPDAGVLATAFAQWTGSAALVDRILVRNPAELYGF